MSPRDPGPASGRSASSGAAAPPWPLELEPEEVRRRFRWARRQGYRGYVWPDVPVPLWRDALREVEAVTRAVLAGGTGDFEGRDRARARALGIAGYTSGLGPLLGRWIESGELAAEGEVADLFAAHLAHGRARAERFRTELARAAGALAEAGVRPLVIKSGHTATGYFPEPGTRPAADLDLVVPALRWAEAEQALRLAGFVRAGQQARPRKSEWRAPGSAVIVRSLEVTHRDDPYALDLHDSLDRNFFGVRTVRLPAGDRRAAPELGAPVDVLEQPTLLVLHALHASEGLHAPTLVRLVELVLMARRDGASGALRTPALLDLLDAADAERFVYPALTLAEALAPGTFDPELLRVVTAAAPRRMRRLIGGLAPSDAQRPTTSSVAEAFLWCRTPWEHLRRLAHMAGPAPAGASPRALAGVYLARAYRLVRGRWGAGTEV